ncbi:spore coat U domain-containing protein [Paracoccus sp. PS-1]|uniref:Csu type fimbrial protein n=1 Tax=unclassified Paracoccus (in: a-proteobacteria) TaxID=2688777 RepID=UPI0018DB52A9|nr:MULTISPECIES: spore coat U domain-containing protein [unclassified Paracoccus (in: a-proteobacteria)]MDQ7262459.1 spore coat U domain-containing protein [Paracoccus sp. PS1]
MIGTKMRAALAGCMVLVPLGAWAQTATDSFDVRITITEECQVISTETLDFGNAGVLTGNVDATASLQVACTSSTPYDIGLGAGEGAGATTTTRQMSSASLDTISYQLFRDSGRTANWGDTVGTDTQAGTGTGAAQSFTIYGRVIPQTTPAPGSYSDNVTVTVTY